MRISITTGSSSKYEKELEQVLKNLDTTTDISNPINRGVEMLRVKTPTKSGKTAGSWGSEIVKTSSGIDAFITNSNVTKNGIPIPILLKNGHGTGTGGYVAPNDFITPVVDIVVKDVSSLIERKLR